MDTKPLLLPCLLAPVMRAGGCCKRDDDDDDALLERTQRQRRRLSLAGSYATMQGLEEGEKVAGVNRGGGFDRSID